MNDYKLKHAVDLIRHSSYPQDLFSLTISWVIDSDGLYHLPQATHLQSPKMVYGTLDSFLDGPRCLISSCQPWNVKSGSYALQAGRILLKLAETEKIIRSRYLPLHVPHRQYDNELELVLAPLRSLVVEKI
jgi:hypothetical protein